MHLNATNIDAIFHDCLFAEDEVTDDYVEGKGVIVQAGFHPGRLETHKGDIKAMISQLNSDLLLSGSSFMLICITPNGTPLFEHKTADKLCALADALGCINYLMPREMWSILPGGMPYVQFTVK